MKTQVLDPNQIIVLQRDCDGRLIPAGTPLALPKGTEVAVTQALGGSFTVNVYGNLVRIAAQDADALGMEAMDLAKLMADLPADASLETRVWTVLKSCYDPEISVNIVDLGLIYAVRCEPVPEHDERMTVHITMTLTSPGCGMGPVIEQDVVERVEALPGISAVVVEMVFDPPWDRDKMSEAARLELGLM